MKMQQRQKTFKGQKGKERQEGLERYQIGKAREIRQAGGTRKILMTYECDLQLFVRGATFATHAMFLSCEMYACRY